jgi:cysteine synthase A
LSAEPNTYWTDQLNNRDSIAGYHAMAEEIWAQTAGQVDAFVHSVGTAASLRGVGAVLKDHNPTCRSLPSSPENRPCSSAASPVRHKIEGVGIGYTSPLWDPAAVDEIIAVPTADAQQ